MLVISPGHWPNTRQVTLVSEEVSRIIIIIIIMIIIMIIIIMIIIATTTIDQKHSTF